MPGCGGKTATAIPHTLLDINTVAFQPGLYKEVLYRQV